MGRLVEGQIPQIFNGVSRQPHSVRFPGQVENAENVVFSVETGGFYKRLGTRIKKKLTGLPMGSSRRLHVINRDSNERYRVVLSKGVLKVFDEDYVERTVTVASSSTAWLDDEPDNFTILSALDYTFIVKKDQVVSMGSTVAPAAPSMTVLYVAAVPDIAAAVYYEVKIDGVVKGSYSATLATDTTTTISTNLAASLTSGLGSGWTVSRSGSFIFVQKNDGTPFTVSTEAPRGDTALLSYKDSIGDASKAPARAMNGMMLEVRGVYGTGFWMKFEAANGTNGEGFWKETLTPGTKTGFDATTMPRALVRNSDGTFTLDMIAWDPKTAGGDDDIPPPDFVGESIRDLVFVRNRLGIVAGETAYFSKAGDYFNFWPDSATEVLDTDPFGLTNTTNSVSRFYFAVPFRRSTFIMGDTAQFEIGGDLLTADLASIDLATSYQASTICRPVAIGDELYFPAEVGKVASIMSYVYEESSVSETAHDVTKHIEGYLPSPIIELIGDPIRGQMFGLSASDRNSLFVHRFYYQGQDRVQSAWGKYNFPGVVIRSIAIIDGVVIMLVDWKGSAWLLELPSVEDIHADYRWTPRLDVHQFLTGTYDAGTDRTTWDLGFSPIDPVAITSSLWPETKQMLSLPLAVSGTTITTKGDWSAHPTFIGENFDAFVELSKQFVRNENGSAIINGRLQLRTMGLRYENTGYFTVSVVPQGRASMDWTFSGRILGSADNQVQRFPILSGTFRFGVRSNADSVTIRIGSDKFMPFSIVSAVWTGFFNEVSRQG